MHKILLRLGEIDRLYVSRKELEELQVLKKALTHQ